MLADHFLKVSLPKVEAEINCMGYSAQQAQLKASQGKMKEAKAHMDNALRSLEVLRQENETKQYVDMALGLFRSMEQQEAMRILHER